MRGNAYNPKGRRMQNSNTRTIRGLSIAVLIFAILAILGAVVIVVVLALFSSVLPEVIDETWAYPYTAEVLREFDELYVSADDIVFLLQTLIGVTVVFIVLFAACSIVCLVASILGLKNHDKPEKLGLVFGWSIAGAVCAFCTMRIVSMVLLIIMAVMINKVRTEARLQAAYAQQSMPYAPYGQPQTYAPYGQPQTPYASINQSSTTLDQKDPSAE